MIARMPRVVYKDLPDGQDWTITEVNDEQVIIINAALDDAGRKAARKAARASLRGGQHLGWLPLPGLITVAEWTRRRAHNPIGAAMMASVITATAVYTITAREEPQRVADPPPTIITVAASPAPSHAAPTTSPTPTMDRATPTGRPTRRDQPIAEPARTREPPARTWAPRTRSARPSPTRASEEAVPDPTRESDSPTAGTPTAGPEPAPDSDGDPPGPEATPPPAADDPPPEEDPPAVDDDPTLVDQPDCGGIHIGLPLDPLLDADVCLLN